MHAYKRNNGAGSVVQEFPDESHEGGVEGGKVAAELPLDEVVQVRDLVVLVGGGLGQCDDLLPGVGLEWG